MMSVPLFDKHLCVALSVLRYDDTVIIVIIVSYIHLEQYFAC